MFRPPLVVLAALLAGIAGCDKHTSGRYNHGDCNPSGCFGCTDDSRATCWPLPYDPCRSSLDCHGGGVCTGIGCCSRCGSDGDCRDGEVCTAGGYCAPGNASTTPVDGTDGGSPAGDGGALGPGVIPCAYDGQCNPGEACVAGQCTHSASCGIPATLCTSNADCGDGKLCSGGACHLGCGGGSACPIGQSCSTGACLDVVPLERQCLLDRDCGAASRCINATCHPLCAKNEQCGRGELCDQGVCRADPRPAAARP